MIIMYMVSFEKSVSTQTYIVLRFISTVTALTVFFIIVAYHVSGIKRQE